VDLDVDRASWVIEQTDALFASDVSEVLDEFDAAFVTTPPRARVDIVRTLANAGKAVFCEKPITGTVEDALRIQEIVEAAGTPFMVGFMRRFHPPYRALKEAALDPELGRPIQFFRRRLGYLDIPEGNWRVTPGSLTGLTVESVSHDIDLLRWLGGEVVEASGEVIESRGNLPGYDDTMVATLRFASGASGLLQVGWSALVEENEVGVMGAHRAAVIDGSGMWRSDRLRVGDRQDRTVEKAQFHEPDATDDGYSGQTKTFLALARGEQVDHPGVRDGVATVEISHKILNSSHGR
jgi:predicted dehydrogenase